ncbi:MAG: bifunctional diaminohydroxyphosphoribosylaminopyrimidine deaminase/5-amino-6-(5-phosphoribosylamino)uracil reductase RibD [Armatimonadota bacterium]|nr:bifunctional diaminohydroxyphosphoribosylaminopyrimidine deaminase/5-amino-6-(5-phosphoribosylamino)uracil reductase RibD [Armatimonadota bacterium]
MATGARDIQRADDLRYMEEALALAARAAGRTSPNPMVGAVVVAGGEVVGRGFHARAGEPHAEILALREAGARARGATVYVTLEPCAHQGRTGPCAEALIAAGVRRVVAAMADPDRQVRGRGFERLRAAGVEVEVGLLENRARRLNEAFVKHRATGLPFVTLKWAMSLDGRIAGAGGRPVAITGEAARRFAHGLRDTHDVVLVGVGTVLADDPLLTCRLPGGRNPMRVVVDSRLRTPPTARVVATAAETPTLVATTAAAPAERVAALRRAGVEVLVQAHEEPRVRLSSLLEELGRRGALAVLVEGGAEVHAAFLAAGLADKVIALVAPVLIGGAGAPAAGVQPAGLDAGPPAARRLRDVRVITGLDGDVAIEGYLGSLPGPDGGGDDGDRRPDGEA